MQRLIHILSLVLLLLAVVAGDSVRAQDKQPPTVGEHVASIASSGVNSVCTKEYVSRLEDAYKAATALAAQESRVSGSVEFSFNTTTSDDLRLAVGGEVKTEEGPAITNLNSVIDLNYGNFPGQLEVNSAVRVQVQDGKFTENVSAASISYDHYLEPWLETFVFIDRYADEYLSIDQRYEIGGGFEFESEWPWRQSLTGKGTTVLREVMAGTGTKEYEFDYDTYSLLGDDFPLLTLESRLQECFQLAAESEFKKELEKDSTAVFSKEVVDANYRIFLRDLEGEIRDARHRITKRYSKFRVGLLVGGLFEIEQAKFALDVDTTTAAGEVLSVEQRPAGTEAFRIEARPMIMYRPFDSVTLRADWFIKWNPFPGESPGPPFDTDSFLKADIRHSINARLQWSVAPISVSLRYFYLNDNRPPFSGTAVASSPDGTVEIEVGPIVARKTRQIWLLTFGFKFP